MRDYVILTDATADHIEDLLDQYPFLDIIPMQVTIDGTVYTYGGRQSEITCQEFYNRQRSGSHATTSLISPAVYSAYFSKYINAGKDILYICFSSRMSGTFQAAQIVAADITEACPNSRIICIDSRNGSTPEGFLVQEAAARFAKGYSLDELATWIEDNCLRIGVSFTVDVLEHLVSGGRLKPAAAAIGTALCIKPFLTINSEGCLEVIGYPRGTKAGLNKMIEKMVREWAPDLGRHVLICHGDDQKKADKLADLVRSNFPEAGIEIGFVDPIIGAHTGPGMVSLVYWGSQR